MPEPFSSNRTSNSRWSSVWVAAGIFVLAVTLSATSGFAETGVVPIDTGIGTPSDTGMDSGASSDAVSDAGEPSDANGSDANGTDTVSDAAGLDSSQDADAMSLDTIGDATGDTTGDAVAPDTSGDVGEPGMSGPATLSGSVDVKLAGDNSLVEIELTPDFASWERTRTTGASGEFAFNEIPTGAYQVTFNRSDYVQVGYSLDIRGDRVLRVTMFPDQSVTLRAEAIFDGDSSPDSVEFSMTGERGDISPSEPISVESNKATWTRNDLPVGNWTLTAKADGYLDANYQLGVRPPEASNQNGQTDYVVRLQMTPEDREAESVSTGGGGCGCRDEDSRGGGGGRIPGGFGPGAMLLIGILALRRWARR